MRNLLVGALLVLALAACEADEHEAARQRTRDAIQLSKEVHERKLQTFAANRAAVIASIQKSLDSKDWYEAARIASEWRELKDPEVAALEAKAEAEKEKIRLAKQAEENKQLAAARAVREKEEKKLAAMEAVRRRHEGVQVGMTAKEVLMSSWGRPESVNQTIFAGHVREQWVYPGYQYLYLDDGILTAISTRR